MAAYVWKGQISFGLVSFPVKLSAAARPERIHFHMLHSKDLSRVKEVWFCAEEDKPIDRADIVKGYEIGKGDYVVIEDDELKQVAPATASSVDISQFVDAAKVDPIYFESSYYVLPDEKAAKAYFLFVAALKDTGQSAIAKIAMHGREHVVLLRPSEDGLLLHTLYFEDELHRARKSAAPKASYSAKELQLAKSLVEHLRAPFKPEQFHDTYRDNVKHLIDQKKKGKKITPTEAPRKAPVVDLMEALKRSLTSSKHGKAQRTRASRRTSQTAA